MSDTMSVKEQLLKAAEYLETHGWRKHGFGGYYPDYERQDCAACVLGAIRSVNPGYREGQYYDAFGNPVAVAFGNYLCRVKGYYGGIHYWNDVGSRDANEVIESLRECAANQEA